MGQEGWSRFVHDGRGAVEISGGGRLFFLFVLSVGSKDIEGCDKGTGAGEISRHAAIALRLPVALRSEFIDALV